MYVLPVTIKLGPVSLMSISDRVLFMQDFTHVKKTYIGQALPRKDRVHKSHLFTSYVNGDRLFPKAISEFPLLSCLEDWK